MSAFLGKLRKKDFSLEAKAKVGSLLLAFLLISYMTVV